MSAALTRQTLESMKRSDLQRICKDHGIKANLKSEALIDLLLDMSQPVRRIPPTPEPKRTSSLRILSRSTAGARLRGRSGGSVIIHDTDEEDETDEGQQTKRLSEPESPSPPAPRTRKAKDTQYRLGVGRPAVAGGSGARAITKSISVSRGKRGKGSRSVKPTEDVIQEEDEPEPQRGPSPEAGPSGTNHEPEPPLAHTESSAKPALTSLSLPEMSEQFKTLVAELIDPLKEQIRSLQTELERQNTHLADIDALTVRVGELTTEVATLRSKATLAMDLEAEVNRLKEGMAMLMLSHDEDATSRSEKRLGKARAQQDVASKNTSSFETTERSGSQTIQVDSSHPATLLGKRHRDSDDSHITGTVEAGREGLYTEKELAKRAVRPAKKRPKLSPENAPEAGPSERATGLTPPSNHGNGLMTSTADAYENTHQETAFNFNFTNTVFHPITSTPLRPSACRFLPSLTRSRRHPRHRVVYQQADMLSAQVGGGKGTTCFTRIPAARAQSQARGKYLAHAHNTDRHARRRLCGPSITAHPPLPAVPEMEPEAERSKPTLSSTEVGAQFGIGAVPLPPETPGPPMKRTMYGTELEGDTRFGDFGVEGVATGFWMGSAPRF
ncbi:hypothetical protein A0H81_00640 [Grifola frondosa]|uniref:Uncharacterized protein n=1 Tax=Grifola frondosa TaxID=5627 RepID=A0A1C7MP79_GRIFR|nr:hypothetical protein A0H81_00640 [Grifola frondosa]